MKKFLLLIILIVSFTQAFSQTYHKLIRENTYWDEIWYDNSFPCNINSIERTFFEGDTLIYGNTYKKMAVYHFYTLSTIGFCPPFAIDTIKHNLSIFMREDTLNRKVYILDPAFITDTSNYEHLLFDFSVEIGDTFYSTYGSSVALRVVSIDSIQLFNAEYRKRIGMLEVNHNYDWDTVYIFESIGSTYGLNHGLWWGIGCSSATLCVKEDNMALWGTECDYYFSDIEEETSSEISIYPNPFSTTFQIKNLENGNIVQIFDGSRRLIKEVYFQNRDVIVDASHFSSGVYYITVLRNNAEPLHKILIKN